MTQHRRAALLISIGSLLSGCMSSPLDPDAQVEVSGIAYAADGTLLAQRKVVLSKEPDLGETLSGLLIVPATGFLACFADQPPALCQGARARITARDGSFVFDLTGKDTQGSVGNASRFTLMATAPATGGQDSGPSALQSFHIVTTQLSLPALRLWDPGLTLAREGAQLRWSLRESLGHDAQLLFEIAGGYAPIWKVRAGNSDSFDLRVLEDVASAAVTLRHRFENAVEITQRGPRLPVPVGPGAPPSRHATCMADGWPEPVTPCPLSDGDLITPAPLWREPCSGSSTDCTQGHASRWVSVDLGAERTISLVVARGLESRMALEVSRDGTTWQAVSTDESSNSTAGDRALALTGITARHLRLIAVGTDASTSASLAGLTELSVW